MDREEALAKMKTDEEMTFGETLGPAMTITDQEQANEYFEVMVERGMRREGLCREEAEKNAKSNIGYFAGYCDNETRKRVNALFGAVHPVFGNNFPTAKEAFKKGVELGKASREGKD